MPSSPDKNSPASLRGRFVSAWAYLPVPVRLAVCGLLLALSLTLNFPVRVPTAVGVNVTLIVHLLLAVRLVMQLVADTAKSPVVEMPMLVSATV